MAYSIPLGLRQLMHYCPIDRNLKPVDGINRTITYTLEPSITNTSLAPAYQDPANLAAWLVGYWAGREETNNEGEK